MLKRIFLLSTLVGTSSLIWAQQNPKSKINDTVKLSTVNAIAKLPITTEVISKTKINEKNLGQDMPILLKNATSVITTSDAGAGVGYTSMRIRGISNNQVNVTFNGVPVNDSDSHGVFWVDFPDLSSSSNEITIQRGVGTSSNGAQAFGASVNLETDNRKKESFANLMTTYGSFNTQKYMMNIGSGDFDDNKFNVDARVSHIKSDGFLDRAHSKLFSTSLNARYMPNKNTEFHIMNIFGHENTYQAWNGANYNQIKKYGRTFNAAGALWDDSWENVLKYYDNQVDNYDQNHLHTYWKQRWNDNWTSKATLHYTRGIGYYEEYEQGKKLAQFELKDFDKTKADLVQRKYLDNHFYGAIFNAEGRLDDLKLFFGASANQYIGDHYGKVEKVINATYSKVSDKFYQNQSNKTEFSAFAKALKRIDHVELFGDVQIRTIQYNADYVNNGKNPNDKFSPFEKNYTFFNPKLGVNYNLENGKLYASYGLTHREPARKDIIKNIDKIKPETLHDFELGYQTNGFVNLGINAYYMYYLDQLVLTGEIDNVGAFIRNNVGKSYRAGVELDASKLILNDKVNLFGNFTYSQNKNIDYKKEINGTVKNLGNTNISFSPDIITSFGFDIIPLKGLKLNMTNKYVSQQYLNNEDNKNLQLNDYFISDALARYEFILDKYKAELSVMVNNIFDREYANNGYDYDGMPYIYSQAGINFLAGIKIHF